MSVKIVKFYSALCTWKFFGQNWFKPNIKKERGGGWENTVFFFGHLEEGKHTQHKINYC